MSLITCLIGIKKNEQNAIDLGECLSRAGIEIHEIFSDHYNVELNRRGILNLIIVLGFSDINDKQYCYAIETAGRGAIYYNTWTGKACCLKSIIIGGNIDIEYNEEYIFTLTIEKVYLLEDIVDNFN